ncbi:MAG: hypothetical protein HYV02_03850 [Deltaproteobacteria bacterium]|nr:hypothetical protein [Deltaproteobacteria bacterium]
MTKVLWNDVKQACADGARKGSGGDAGKEAKAVKGCLDFFDDRTYRAEGETIRLMKGGMTLSTAISRIEAKAAELAGVFPTAPDADTVEGKAAAFLKRMGDLYTQNAIGSWGTTSETEDPMTKEAIDYNSATYSQDLGSGDTWQKRFNKPENITALTTFLSDIQQATDVLDAGKAADARTKSPKAWQVVQRLRYASTKISGHPADVQSKVNALKSLLTGATADTTPAAAAASKSKSDYSARIRVLAGAGGVGGINVCEEGAPSNFCNRTLTGGSQENSTTPFLRWAFSVTALLFDSDVVDVELGGEVAGVHEGTRDTFQVENSQNLQFMKDESAGYEIWADSYFLSAVARFIFFNDHLDASLRFGVGSSVFSANGKTLVIGNSASLVNGRQATARELTPESLLLLVLGGDLCVGHNFGVFGLRVCGFAEGYIYPNLPDMILNTHKIEHRLDRVGGGGMGGIEFKL